MDLSIVLPVYNEKDTLYEIVERLRQVDGLRLKEIILVDDCSTDGTRELLEGGFDDPIFVKCFHAEN